MKYAVVFSVLVQFVTSDNLLMTPLRRCVPTTTVRGPCHVCVCTAEGLFHCRAEMCRDEELRKQISNEKECEPEMMYREISIFCRCSDTGFWLSAECRDVFKTMRPKDFTMRAKAATNLFCIPNALYLLDCNICLCQDKGFIDFSSCTNRRCTSGHKADKCGTGDYLRLDKELCTCSDIHFYVDHLCLKVDNLKVQIVNRSTIANIIDIGEDWEELSAVEKRIQSSSCTSDSQYVLDCNKCVCYMGSMACTNKSCDINKSLRSGDVLDGAQSLPMLESEKNRCNPGQKYRYKCNTCICSANGEASCTTMICLEDFVIDMAELHKS